MTPHQQHSYLTSGDVTRLLRVDKSTVYRMAEDGRLPGFRVGRQWRFPVSDIEEALGMRLTSRVADPVDRATPLLSFFADTSSLMVVMTDLAGQPLTEVFNPSAYFELLLSSPSTLSTCVAEWRGYADEYDLMPSFHQGQLGFECARAFVREGFELVAMVIAGGIAPREQDTTAPRIEALARDYDVDYDDLAHAAGDLPHLDDRQRDDALATLSVVAHHLSNEHSTPKESSTSNQISTPRSNP